MNKAHAPHPYEIGDDVDYTCLLWETSSRGCEVGYPETDVVAICSDPYHNCIYYTDAETGEVIGIWELVEDDE